MQLSPLQGQICNALQKGVAVCPEPFQLLADQLGINQLELIKHIQKLQESGVIKSFRAFVDYRSLGRVATLVTAHVPDKTLETVVRAVNRLESVSHNYLRKHHYNLWFTLQGGCFDEIEAVLDELSDQFGTEFHSLPAIRFFKLDVRFDCTGRDGLYEQVIQRPRELHRVRLTQNQKLLLRTLQAGIAVCQRPFREPVLDDMNEDEMVNAVSALVDAGVIRKIAAGVDYRLLGFTENVMLACRTEKKEKAGNCLARFRNVSHCIQRKPFLDFDYDVFAMVHARGSNLIQCIINDPLFQQNIDRFVLLPTIREFKKMPSSVY